MTLEVVRRIRGNVHGSVDITTLEDVVISHPFFQRLRRIRQLAFLHYVFPGATHTRFEHSLGVMHLAGTAWEKLWKNQSRLSRHIQQIKNYADLEAHSGSDEPLHGLLMPTFEDISALAANDQILQTFRLAGLLHDIGHSPFSHSGERFLPSYHDLIAANELPDYLEEVLQQYAQKYTAHAPVRHEFLSAIMVDHLLREVQPSVAEELRVDPRDVNAIILPQVKPAEGSILKELRVLELCRELLSGELDVDRMDYLLRDSRECGVVYGIFDAGRILDSLCAYHNPQDGQHHVAIQFAGLAAFEDYLRARHSMYLQLYFHKASVAGEAMLQQISRRLGGYKLPAEIKAYAQVDEFNMAYHLGQRAQGLAPQAKAEVEALVRDLLFERKLWKRVYEVIFKLPRDSEHNVGINLAQRILEQDQVPFELISSTGALTRFKPRAPLEPSRNALRLVKKDRFQYPRVVPVEDYCQVVEKNDLVAIDRIYAAPGQVSGGQLRNRVQELRGDSGSC